MDGYEAVTSRRAVRGFTDQPVSTQITMIASTPTKPRSSITSKDWVPGVVNTILNVCVPASVAVNV